jgi:hypothetical protein
VSFVQSDKNRIRTSFRVTLETQHDLWSTVPSGSDVLCHVSSILLWINGESSRKTKITNLELAVGIDEQVTGLEITMKDVGAVNVLETTEDLIDERLKVSVSKRLTRTNDGREIAFHQLYHQSAWSAKSKVTNLRRDNTR